MTATNLEAAMAFTLSEEGEWSFDPLDPGGATNQGITLNTFRQHFGQNQDVAELRAMTNEQRDMIYKTYWDAIHGDDLPSGLDLLMFDFHFTSGGAVGVLQKQLGVTADGIIGPMTIEASQTAMTAGAEDFLTILTDNRVAYYVSLDMPRFIDGWTTRAYACETKAIALSTE